MTNKTTLKSIIALLVFFMATSFTSLDAKQKVNPKDLLTEELLNELVMERFLDRDTMSMQDRRELFIAFTNLELLKVEDWQKLYAEYYKPVKELEAQMCKEMIESYESNGDLSSSNGFGGDEEDLEEIRGGKYFTPVGFVREMLITKFGEEKGGIIRASYDDVEGDSGDEYDDEYEEEYNEEGELLIEPAIVML